MDKRVKMAVRGYKNRVRLERWYNGRKLQLWLVWWAVVLIMGAIWLAGFLVIALIHLWILWGVR